MLLAIYLGGHLDFTLWQLLLLLGGWRNIMCIVGESGSGLETMSKGHRSRRLLFKNYFHNYDLRATLDPVIFY